MRGADLQQSALFSYLSPEQRVPKDHPLRKLLPRVDAALARMSRRFTAMYAQGGRPSIAPEKLLRALLLQILYSVRSERLLMERLDHDLLFRWFVGLNLDDPVWDATVYSKNRERLLSSDVAGAFFRQVVAQARQLGLLSDEHFTVDGTLSEAWASQKSFKPQAGGEAEPPAEGRNPEVHLRGEKRRNDTHPSTTGPEARLYKKAQGQEAKRGYLGPVLMENRHGWTVNTRLTLATGPAEREAAVEMVRRRGKRRVTLGGDKNYDTQDLVKQLRQQRVTPHVAQNNTHRSSALDGRTTRHAGYAVSQRKRKRVEEIFGWMKTIGLMRKVRHRGRELVEWMFTYTAAAYNLMRMTKLLGANA
ncbi:MAG: IS5 family transposase [Terriglobia bacterium]|jgi:transposase